MSKRNLLVLFLFGIILLVSLYFVTKRGPSAGFGDPYKAIPSDACLVLESSDLPGLMNRLSGKSGLFREISSIKELSDFRNTFSYLDTVLSKKEVRRVFGFGSSVVSFHVIGKGRLVPLLSLNVTPELKQRHIKDVLVSAGATVINETKYEETAVFEIPLIRGKETVGIYVSFRSGSLLCTPSRVLLEAAIRQYDEPSDIRSEESFAKVFQAAGRNEDRLFVIFKKIGRAHV